MNKISIAQAVLGSIIINNNNFKVAKDKINSSYFEDPKDQNIYLAIEKLLNQNKNVDLITLHEECKRIDNNISAQYLAKIFQFTPTNKIENYLDTLIEQSLRRFISEVDAKYSKELKSPATDVKTVLNNKINELETLRTNKIFVEELSPSQLAEKTLKEYELRLNKTDRIYTGLRLLDYKTSGFGAGDMVIIGGRPSMGKTTRLLEMVYNWSVKGKKDGLLITLENRDVQDVEIMTQFATGIPYSDILEGYLSDNQFKQYKEFLESYKESKLHILQKSKFNELDLIDKAKEYKDRFDIKYVALDYADIMQSSKNLDNTSKHNLIADSMKELATDLAIPVIVLKQLNRELRNRSGNEPTLFDLKGSGNYEQNADVVIFPHRPDYYNNDHNSPNVEMIVAKRRGTGRTGKVYCNTDLRTMTIKEEQNQTPRKKDSEDIF